MEHKYLGQEVAQSIANSLKEMDHEIKSNFNYTKNEVAAAETRLKALVEVLLTANIVAAMIDKTKIYVYIGNEANYIKGNQYYWNGSSWVSGGIYGFSIDTTLTISGNAVDAKIVEDKIEILQNTISSLQNSLNTLLANMPSIMIKDQNDQSFTVIKGLKLNINQED